ncbi:toprim domain-containing protein [Variovorax sp. dw_308]|uniref:toprim domain-containing protein n=1 Tax=Variovorax sp. dw_308 TaxID=2721546 RepID=UPI001C44C8E5|nr:toprim domain-containing protein [Variovorax sp. dw_308]
MIIWTDLPIGDHRTICPACGRKPNDKTMGVTIAADDHGVAHCFRCGYVETRHHQRELTPAERKAFARRMDALRRQHDAEQLQRHVDAAAAAAIRWAAAEPAAEHPYLTAKSVRAHGIRIEAGHTLLIPLRDAVGHLHGLQSIAPDGSKRFMPGARVKGCYHAIGRPSGRLVICEGYATGATIHEDSGDAVAIAFNAGNLQPVAKALRTKFPCITLVVAADDDWKTDGNPGMTAATEAARAVGGLLAVPDFTDLPRGDDDTDFNDLHRLDATREVQP